MSETLPPALTEAEWADSFLPHNFHDTRGERTVFIACDEVEKSRHALAALCLYGQPYGFTREDVTMLDDLRGLDWEDLNLAEARALGAQVRSLMSRIAALLPPA